LSKIEGKTNFSRRIQADRNRDCWEQETQLSLTNRATPLEVSQGHQTMARFYMLRMVSYHCAIVTLSVKRTTFFRNSISKMSLTWKPG